MSSINIKVTGTEYAYNSKRAANFILALLLVDFDKRDGFFCVPQPLEQVPDGTVASINIDQFFVRSLVPEGS